jgi:hypothetical protein
LFLKKSQTRSVLSVDSVRFRFIPLANTETNSIEVHTHLLHNNHAIVPVGKRRKNQECIEDEALETWNDEADAESDSEDRCHPVEGLASGVGHLSDYETAADVAEDCADEEIAVGEATGQVQGACQGRITYTARGSFSTILFGDLWTHKQETARKRIRGTSGRMHSTKFRIFPVLSLYER